MSIGALDHGSRSVLVLLVLVVLLPTAGLVWFMSAAMGNERAAAREALTAAHRARLEGQAERVAAAWESRRAHLDNAGSRGGPAALFASLVRDGSADSAIVYDSEGRVLYPADTRDRLRRHESDSTAWRNAQRLEFGEGKPLEAARAYANIAKAESSPDVAARALQARARCLGKGGRPREAIEILLGDLGAERFAQARDARGRLVAPDSFLLALHLASSTGGDEVLRAASLLRVRLENYGEPTMPIAQRRFLMRRLAEIAPNEPPVETFAAERLAEEYLSSDPVPAAPSKLTRSPLVGVWRLASTDGTVVALLREESMLEWSLGELAPVGSEGRIELVPPGREPETDPFLAARIGGVLSGWGLALHLDDRTLVAALASEEVAGYVWTGALLIAAAVLLAGLAAGAIRRQTRLTKLKNDLVATVTHELKTPLASMRLLVDTLLDGAQHDPQQVRDYLALLSRENSRLSRLIDDFLAFSRMERNKLAFEKVELEPASVVQAAAEAVRPRLDEGGCDLDVEIDGDLPRIVGDPEALSTVLVNLLDNAYKYSRDDKRIRLHAYGENGSVVFDVEDHGIGLSRRSAKRVFERFYQVDDSLSRGNSGVGLGLAIVKFIVEAHQGRVSVTSTPGEGSTFRVRVPAASAQAPG